MAYKIPSSCNECDTCRPLCPTGAIQVEKKQYWVDSTLCNNCEGYYPEPQCVTACPINVPVPSPAKKGRHKINPRTATSPDLFPDGKTHPFASAIAIWKACNVLAQRRSLPWETDEKGQLYFQQGVNQGKGAIAFRLINNLQADPTSPFSHVTELSGIEAFDIRAACLHLIYAAYATTLDKPWEQEFIISDRQIEEYLGLDKRKDLSKSAKLTLIKELAQQPCRITTSINWPQQGNVQGFSLKESPLWHLLGIEHHFQEDAIGCKHLIGLTFRVRAGIWTQYFLNKQGCKQRSAFYQYGSLPKVLLTTVMSIWQQHEGAARIMLWLLFKTKIGREQRITVPTLMRVAYGDQKVIQASSQREERKRLQRTFESDLEILNHYGLKPVFDPITYPPEIQPLWAKLVDLPDDAEEALDFWMNDGGSNTRLTDSAPRGKWNRLMNARISCFEIPPGWERPSAESEKKKQKSRKAKTSSKTKPTFDNQQLIQARKSLQLSQRALAEMTGKSQSWIRDIENGRFRANSKDQMLLQKALGLV
ncbi:MAG TPA: helix-turn-helix domain-containing protein [Stenomitos sp.]